MAAPHPREVLRFILRSSKRIAVSVVGAVLVLGGLAMLVLPGPGLLVIVAGFAVLGTEYAWAAAALERTKRAAGSAGRVAKDTAGKAGRAATGLAQGAASTAKGAATTAKGAAGAATKPLRRRPAGDSAPDDQS